MKVIFENEYEIIHKDEGDILPDVGDIVILPPRADFYVVVRKTFSFMENHRCCRIVLKKQ